MLHVRQSVLFFDKLLSFIFIIMHTPLFFCVVADLFNPTSSVSRVSHHGKIPSRSQHSTLPLTVHPHALTRDLEIETLPSYTPRICYPDFPTRRFDRSLPIAGFAESFGHADGRREMADCAARSCEAECWEGGAMRIDCDRVRG